MPKLYFRYGCMSSSKTANLLMVAHNYKQQQKNIITLKPSIDNRFGIDIIKSRTNMEIKADFVVKPNDRITYLFLALDLSKISCILVDEANLFTEEQIDELRILTKYIPVICYGLRTDYQTKLFPGSKRLLELADSIEEIKTTCEFCNRKAIINYKHKNEYIIKSGSTEIDIGAEDKYGSICWKCWSEKDKL